MMKKKMAILLVLSLVVIVAFYGVAFSGGGWETYDCSGALPAPKSGSSLSGPTIMGTFTVARDVNNWGNIWEEGGHYNVQLVLKKGSVTHAYYFATNPGPNGSWTITGICGTTAETLMGVGLGGYGWQPCLMGIGTDFGYNGIPIISDLVIQGRDRCPANDNPNLSPPDKPAVIYGDIVIRVVVPPTP